jgi:hypothetical protein
MSPCERFHNVVATSALPPVGEIDVPFYQLYDVCRCLERHNLDMRKVQLEPCV